MKKILFAGIALAALTASTASFAADLPRRSQAPAPYVPVSAPVFTWTGFYVGANAGYSFGNFTRDANFYWGSNRGGSVGLQGGYNYQVGQFVAGLEGDIQLSNIHGNKSPLAGINGSGKVSSFGSLRGRAGVALDRALLYVTGGYAGGNIKGGISGVAPAFAVNDSHYHNGYALGAGIEYAFTQNISAKGEYLYTSLGNKGYYGAAVPSQAGASFSTVRAGVNYRF